MKRNSKLFIILLLLGVFSTGISFAFFLVGITYVDEGNRNIGGTPVKDILSVEFSSTKSALGDSIITPGDSDSVNFNVNVTPKQDVYDVVYAIKLNIKENTFVKCTVDNKNSFDNDCAINAEELKYTLKDEEQNIIASGTLEGIIDDIVIVKEAKEISENTSFKYEFIIDFIETGYDQNHNAGKTFSADIVVEFAEPPTAAETILANKEIADRGTIETIFTENTTGKIYNAEDNDGDSYYFAGAVDNNYVRFANKTWRIVRINGDGSIRLILNSGFTNEKTKFNESSDDNKYVGFKYSDNKVSGTDNPSAIYTYLMTWYSTNLLNFNEFIEQDAGFCGDRSLHSGTGLGTKETYYGAYTRLRESLAEKKPTLICKNNEDLYTTSGASKGNGSLQYPIGLITADELTLAGALHNVVNDSYYLYSANTWWTMTPYRYSSNNNAHVYYIEKGKLTTVYHVSQYTWLLVRPVINLRADTIFNYDGDGSSTNPYTIKGAE